ncbi:adhesion G protein-coupled receptor L4 [Pimephales promelas]|nr:adhesion G protein-coupled receptor L4 [Pimephales promelas]
MWLLSTFLLASLWISSSTALTMALRFTSSQLLGFNYYAPPSLDIISTLQQHCLLRRRPYIHRGSRRNLSYYFNAENSIHSLWSSRSSLPPGNRRNNNIRIRHPCTHHVTSSNLLPVSTSATWISKQKPLKTALYNTRSLNNKSLLLCEFITDNKLDFLCLTETWHKPMDYIALNQTTPPGYSFIDNPHLDRRGGGIAVIYRSIISIRPIPVVSSFEHLAFRLPGSQSLIAAVIYRPPKTCSSFLSDFTDFVTQLSSISPSVLLIGDFNIHIDSPEAKFTSDFLDILNCLNLTQHVTSPTHKHGHILDLVCSTPSLTIHNLSLTDLTISDHLAITLDIITPCPTAKHTRTITFRNLKSISPFALTSSISHAISTSSLPSAPTASDLVNFYNHSLSTCLNQIAPLKTASVSFSNSAPCFSSFSPLSPSDTSKLLSTMKFSNYQLDPIPSQLFKACQPILIPLITNIINTSFMSGSVPSPLKLASITPLLKKPGLDPDNLDNFRPISNLSHDNECEKVPGICGPHANCTNTIGNYYCTCLSGFKSNGKQEFQTNDGTKCTDIDECEVDADRCGPSSKCHNINGSFICSCLRGYTSPAGPWFKPKTGTDCTENPEQHCHQDYKCFKVAISNTLQKMINLSTPERLKEIRHQTSAELSPVLLISYIEAMASHKPGNGDEPEYPEEEINETITNLVFSVNNLVEKDEKVEWERINDDLRKYYITTLLHTAEMETLALSAGYTHTMQMQVDAGEVEMKLYTFEPNQAHKHPVSTNIQGNSISLIPKNAKNKSNNGSTSIVFLIYNSIGDLLKPTDDPGVADYSRYAAAGEITVNSPVIAAAISNPKTFALDNVTFTLKHTQEIDPTHDETKCAFWEYSQSMMGQWSLDGCTRTRVNSTHTSCSCNHLTHFAILMSSAHANLLAHYNVLTRITHLGMVISIICLSLCIFTFWFFRDIQNTRTTIHKNLCCSLFMAQFIFLIGINKIAHKWFCSIIAGLLHYFFLSAFAWMCIEGIHLYLIVVGVIYNKGFLHRNFYIFGYGSPAVVVAISATLGYKYYGTSTVMLCIEWLYLLASRPTRSLVSSKALSKSDDLRLECPLEPLGGTPS